MPSERSHANRALVGRRRPPRRHPLVAICILLALAFAPEVAIAQRGGSGFLFGAPRGALNLRGGLGLADAGSEVFDFATSELTLGRSDFNGPTLGFDLAFRLHRRIDLVLTADYIGSRSASEFRDWVDQDDRPIEQTTSFRRVPLTAGIRAYLTPRGRQIGNYVWIPARLTPYIGAGGGMLWYRFSQRGDFVDFNTLEIFSDNFSSAGWTTTIHLLAGLEYMIGPRWAVVLEGKSSRARADLGPDFQDFDPIDLSGLSTTIGIQLRF